MVSIYCRVGRHHGHEGHRAGRVHVRLCVCVCFCSGWGAREQGIPLCDLLVFVRTWISAFHRVGSSVCVCVHLCACVLVQGCVTSRVPFGCELRYPCWRCWFEQEAYELLQLWPNMAGELQRSHESRLDNWSMLAMALARSAPPGLTREILQRTVPSVCVQAVHALSRNSTGLLPNQHQLVSKISMNGFTSRLKGGG